MRLPALVLAALLWAGGAAADCRQALVLALDISGSVDAGEYRQQLEGLAAALTDAQVRAALFAMPGAPVELAVFEWSGPAAQRLILPWTRLSGPAALEAAAARLVATRRVAADPSTAIGAAMRHAAALFAQRPRCWRHVLDISGDGRSNAGPRPQTARADAELAGVTINALVVGGEAPRAGAGDGGAAQLADYFRAWVFHGPGAFVQVALGYGDYERAMKRKLLRELQVMAVSDAPLQ